MKLEAGIGIGLGLLGFMALEGLNLVPILFVLALGGLLLLTPLGGRRLGGRRIALQPEPAALASFAEVGGQAAAKQELLEALDFVNRQDQVQRLGIRPLKGVLLSGPPGTGKTLLAKAAASYTDAVFLATSGSEFIEMYAGVGAQRVRALFREARTLARRENKRTAVIFVDEIEVLAPERGKHRGHLEYDQTLNQLLVEMDGLNNHGPLQILIIGATNRSDLLDRALMRPGRFDRVVQVGMPDRGDRLAILELHTQNKPVDPDVDLDEVAKSTFGFSGAHLESLANEAAILALREGLAQVAQRHFQEAVDKVIMGEKLGRRPGRTELERIAAHEGGHALLGELIAPGSVATVTIVSRGMALGYVRRAPADDRFLMTKEQLEQQIDAALAGPVAEEMLCGSRSTGAAHDLRAAADAARQLVLAGMSALGLVAADTVPRGTLHRAVCRVLAERQASVQGVLAGRHPALVAIRDLLLERETISGGELRQLLDELGPAAGEAAEGDLVAHL